MAQKARANAVAQIRQLQSYLPVRSTMHLTRKLWHMAMGVGSTSLYMLGVLTKEQCLALLIPIMIFAVVMEVLRHGNPALNEKCVRFFGPLMRTNEVHGINGMTFYVAGVLFAVLVFPKPVACLSMLFLALADPVASAVGIRFGKKSLQLFKGKSLHGSFAAFTVCAITTWLFLKSNGMVGLDLIRLTLLGGFAGAVSEALPIELDDNFTIPVFSGFIMWIGFLTIQFV